MKTSVFSCLATVFPLLCATGPAQDMAPPPPAPQLEKFDALLGTWEVSGTSRETHDGPDLPWTAKQTVRRVLGGHFIRDEMVIETPIGQIMFVGFTGWDAENGRYMSYMASNMGMVSSTEMFVTGETFVNAAVNVMEGMPVTERAVMKMEGDDSYSFSADSAIGDGPVFTMVQGSGKKVSKDAMGQAVNAAFVPVPAEMKPFEKMSGTYEITGTMIPMPGVPEMPLSGTEVVSMIMGGVIQQSHVTGEVEGAPDAYEGYGFTTWNARNKCYDSFMVDNMGMAATQELRMVDDRTVVGTVSGVQYGQPMVARLIMKLDPQGEISTVTSHSIAGVADPQQVFSGTYTKKR